MSAEIDHTERDRFELLIACLLGAAALLTAFCALRASLLGDTMLAGFTTSTQHYNDAIGFEAEQTQVVVEDHALFLRYIDAVQRKEADFGEYLRESLFNDNLEAAAAWWEDQRLANPDAKGPMTPFDPGSPYAEPYAVEIEELNRLGDTAFAEGAAADDKGDKFDIAAAILAISLFAGGIASLLKSRRAQRLMAGMAIAAIVVGGWFAAQGQFG